MKIKKTFIGLFIACGFTHVMAAPQVCPFTDYFSISAPEGFIISSLNSNGNINAIATDLTHFKTYCKSNSKTDGGVASVTVSNMNSQSCTLQILDGPFELNPTVIDVICYGDLSYKKMEHERGTYTYTLQFESKE